MEKKIIFIWIGCAIALTILTIYTFIGWNTKPITNVMAYSDKSMFFTTTTEHYNMTDLLENYNFTLVRTIFIEDPKLNAYEVKNIRKLSTKRSSTEINNIIQENTDITQTYPIIASKYVTRQTVGHHHSAPIVS